MLEEAGRKSSVKILNQGQYFFVQGAANSTARHLPRYQTESNAIGLRGTQPRVSSPRLETGLLEAKKYVCACCQIGPGRSLEPNWPTDKQLAPGAGWPSAAIVAVYLPLSAWLCTSAMPRQGTRPPRPMRARCLRLGGSMGRGAGSGKLRPATLLLAGETRPQKPPRYRCLSKAGAMN